MVRSGWLLLFLLHLTPLAWAQKSEFTLPTGTLTYLVESDPSTKFSTQNVSNGRMDMDAGVLRASYRIQPTMKALATAELTARAWMQQQQAQFGWTTTDDLDLLDKVETPYSTHLTFQQTMGGLPVHRRVVKVNLGSDGLPTMVLSDYAPHLQDVDAFDSSLTVSESEIRLQVEQMIAPGRAWILDPELVVYPSDPPVLAWRIVAGVKGAPGEWEVVIDGHSGTPLYVLDLARYRHSRGAENKNENQRIDGKGMVWSPDPITSAGVPYGNDYVDADDADLETLNNERINVDLLDIKQNDAAKYVLQGPHVSIVGDIGDFYSPPAEDDPASFNYSRSNQHFEAVMVYYHIDTSQRYVQSLNIGWDIQSGGIRANPHGLGDEDNSAYYTSQNALAFGDGGIDDAEDAEVILHEYGHALLTDSAPNIIGDEADAMHEGWSDYWAVSFTRGLMDEGLLPSGEWRKVFKWDGNETWNGRFLQTSSTYPDDFDCVNSSNPSCDIYADGVVWATTMMEIYDVLGKETTDVLNLTSHGYLDGAISFVDAAEAIIQADTDRYQGANLNNIRPILDSRGFLQEPTSVEDPFDLPAKVELFGNYPEPSYGRTTVRYSLPENMSVHIAVYNTLGQQILILQDGSQSPGIHTQEIDLSDLARGLYFLRLRAGRETLTEPVLLTH